MELLIVIGVGVLLQQALLSNNVGNATNCSVVLLT